MVLSPSFVLSVWVIPYSCLIQFVEPSYTRLRLWPAHGEYKGRTFIAENQSLDENSFTFGIIFKV